MPARFGLQLDSGGSALATHRSRAEPRLRERLFSRVGPDLTTTAH
jgi:hypothetical protein